MGEDKEEGGSGTGNRIDNRVHGRCSMMTVIREDGSEREWEHIMKGYNMSAVYWVQQCKGERTRCVREG